MSACTHARTLARTEKGRLRTMTRHFRTWAPSPVTCRAHSTWTGCSGVCIAHVGVQHASDKLAWLACRHDAQHAWLADMMQA
eukprot:1159328-Pelagomonas_calceolata.AAC.10